MSTGNHWVDDQIAAAGSQLAQLWKDKPRQVQPENALKPDSAALQFRIKILEDRVETLERVIQNWMRNNGR